MNFIAQAWDDYMCFLEEVGNVILFTAFLGICLVVSCHHILVITFYQLYLVVLKMYWVVLRIVLALLHALDKPTISSSITVQEIRLRCRFTCL